MAGSQPIELLCRSVCARDRREMKYIQRKKMKTGKTRKMCLRTKIEQITTVPCLDEERRHIGHTHLAHATLNSEQWTPSTDNKKVINFTDAAVADSSFFLFVHFFLSLLALLWCVLPFKNTLSRPVLNAYVSPNVAAAVANMKNNFIPFVFGWMAHADVGSFLLFPSSSNDFSVDRINCFDILRWCTDEALWIDYHRTCRASRHSSRCLLQLDDDIIASPICACRFESMAVHSMC